MPSTLCLSEKRCQVLARREIIVATSESITLIQTGKATIYPIVLLDSPGKTFWLNWLAFIRVELVDSGLISADDLHLIHVTKNPAEAMEHIDRFYRIFHSYRFVRDAIVIRLNTHLPAQWVEHLERDFSDLILSAIHQIYFCFYCRISSGIQNFSSNYFLNF